MDYKTKTLKEVEKKFKITQRFEIVGKHSEYRFETFKITKNDYGIIIRRFNTIKNSWEYDHSSGYIETKEELKHRLLKLLNYYLDN